MALSLHISAGGSASSDLTEIVLSTFFTASISGFYVGTSITASHSTNEPNDTGTSHLVTFSISEFAIVREITQYNKNCQVAVICFTYCEASLQYLSFSNSLATGAVRRAALCAELL